MLNQSAVLDRTFQALADPTRRAMIERLGEGPASVSELAKPLKMSLPAVVQHLAVLEAGGLVRSRKQGRVRTCELDIEVLDQVGQWIADRRQITEQRLDRLGTWLAENPEEGER
ncbi:ArsR/SmtB family transcription factor [Kineosporia babensis]|uniref:Metalloregulator ArsR/SmtB family transcription factor n=1 Tax=Kineosporia babensis TaxID=499548 RepID=A0A9X1STX1_9ACTN|nr:metalloregulator ArsR/SmtB family transcription factor [Kineosporia babensis]